MVKYLRFRVIIRKSRNLATLWDSMQKWERLSPTYTISQSCEIFEYPDLAITFSKIKRKI